MAFVLVAYMLALSVRGLLVGRRSRDRIDKPFKNLEVDAGHSIFFCSKFN
jgi:hypothetical protein